MEPVVLEKRVRRFDPERKDRILDAALAVIAEHGVAGTTHRLVAAAADVPLGSLTYHFASLGSLRAQAFARHARRMEPAYAARFAQVRTREDLVEAVTDLIRAGAGMDSREWAITYELYLEALRRPELREITERWMRSSRRVLERFVDPATARRLDALIEGLVMHDVLSTDPMTRDQTRAAVAQTLSVSSKISLEEQDSEGSR